MVVVIYGWCTHLGVWIYAPMHTHVETTGGHWAFSSATVCFILILFIFLIPGLTDSEAPPFTCRFLQLTKAVLSTGPSLLGSS